MEKLTESVKEKICSKIHFVTDKNHGGKVHGKLNISPIDNSLLARQTDVGAVQILWPSAKKFVQEMYKKFVYSKSVIGNIWYIYTSRYGRK